MFMAKSNSSDQTSEAVDKNGVSSADTKQMESKANITNEEKNVILLESTACADTLNNFSDLHGLLSKNSMRSSNFVLNLSFGFSVANLAAFSSKYATIAMQSKDGSTYLFKRSKAFNFPPEYKYASDLDRYTYMIFWEQFIAFYGLTCLFRYNKSQLGLSARETVNQISSFGLPYGVWSYVNMLTHPVVNYSLGSDRGVLIKHFNCDGPEVYFGVNPYVQKLHDNYFSKGDYGQLYTALTFLSGLHNSMNLDTLFYNEDDACYPSVLGAGEVFYAQDDNKNFYICSMVTHGMLTSARISFSALFDIRLTGVPRFKQYKPHVLNLTSLDNLNTMYSGEKDKNVIHYYNLADSIAMPTPKTGQIPILPSTVDIDKSVVFAIVNYVMITGDSDLILNSCWFIMTGDTVSMTFSPLYNGDPSTQSIGIRGNDSGVKDYAERALKSHGIDLEGLVDQGKQILVDTAINAGIGTVLNRTPVGRVIGLVARAQGALPPRQGRVRR